MSCVAMGILDWSMSEDSDGHRTYKVKHRVKADTVADGPASARIATGLPLPGSYWQFGGDVDLWAFCQRDADVKRHTKLEEGEVGVWWSVEQTFTTKGGKKCSEEKIEDPLLEPAKISGGHETHKEEATHDMFGLPILTSSHEMVRGPQVEFPESWPTITIEQNVATLEQAFTLPTSMLNCVNDHWLWGLPPRTILLRSAPWEKKYYGNCYYYYSRKLEFAINPRFWDRRVLDEGTKVLCGHWSSGEWVLDAIDDEDTMPDPDNPLHFIQFKDRNGENCKVVLDGAGRPSGAIVYSGPREYVSIADANEGNILGNIGAWLPLGSSGSTWASTGTYVQGDVVTHESQRWVALVDNFGDEPGGGAWLLLPEGLHWDAGVYDGATEYVLGDVVTDPDVTSVSQPGEVYIAKHLGVNFLLLGIPTTF